MDRLTVERIGGLAGFAGMGSKIKSRGEVSLASLGDEDRLVLDQLFKTRNHVKASKAVPDGFCYKISRNSKSGVQTIEVPEASVPLAIAQCVKDELI